HRDLKPANIRLTPDGRVKVMDFGLAKALESDARATSLSQSPTFAVSAMTTGMIIGTAAYMSPEQARGQSADRRADIWSFGVVLYEMLTGARAFDGETVSDTLAAVLRAEPDRALLPKDLPARARTLLDRCLEKSPRRRLRDIGEAVLLLEDLLAGRGAETETTTVTAPASPVRGRAQMWWPWAVAALALIAAGAAMLRPGPQPTPLRKFTLALQNTGNEIQLPMISPNGRQLAYVQSGQLWVRDLTLLTSRRLAEGLDEDFRPVWSPDGEDIAFARNSGLSRVSVAGGAVAPVCGSSEFTGGSGGTWTEDGRILFARGHDHIYEVAAGGGVATIAVPRIDSLEGDLHHPVALPGKREIACIIHTLQGGPSEIALAEPGKRRTLFTIPGGLLWDLAYDRRGYLIFGRLGEGVGLWALPFSIDRLKVTGEPFLIAPEGSSPSVSTDGTLAYRLGATSVESEVVVLDRSGAVLDTLSGRSRRGHWSVHPSPDGRQLAVEVRESGEGDVWIYDLERKSESRFAFGTSRQGEPAWSTDGRELAYREFAQGTVMTKPADGSRAPRLLTRGSMAQYTPDGKHILFCREVSGGIFDIWYRALDGSADSVTVVATPSQEMFPMPAPQGGYMAFASDESDQFEVYLKPYPAGEGRWQVSANGGTKPLWNRTGNRIYYLNIDKFYEVEIQLTPGVQLGTPRLLFDLSRLKLQSFGRYYVVPTSDPDRFIAIQPTANTVKSPTDAVLVENWPAEFAKKK
ncbi:MAG: protein kinase, partial [Candidatus Eisenbacteria bacterium]